MRIIILLMAAMLFISGCGLFAWTVPANGYAFTGDYCTRVAEGVTVGGDKEVLYQSLSECENDNKDPTIFECELRLDGVECSIGECKNQQCVPKTTQTCAAKYKSCSYPVKPCCAGSYCDNGICRNIPDDYKDDAPQNKDSDGDSIPDYLDNDEPNCYDSDDKDYDVQGVATFLGIPFIDTCQSKSVLREYYCSGDDLKHKDKTCLCDDGKCIPEVTVIDDDTDDDDPKSVEDETNKWIIIVAVAFVVLLLTITGLILVVKK